jgi:hypothetical protein
MTTKQARDVEPKGFLFSPDILTKGEGDQTLYRYRNPKLNMVNYANVLIAPVIFFRPENASPEELADLKKLAINFSQFLEQELAKDYRVVNAPQAGALKIETALIDVEKSMPAMDFISTVLPVGLGVSILKDFATGKPASVGDISGEMKISDSLTGELLVAVVDERVGGKSFSNMFDSWGDANSAMEFWAKKLRYGLCVERGAKNCEKPGNY